MHDDFLQRSPNSEEKWRKIYVDLINKNWKLDVKESIVIKEWLRRKEIKKKDWGVFGGELMGKIVLVAEGRCLRAL